MRSSWVTTTPVSYLVKDCFFVAVPISTLKIFSTHQHRFDSKYFFWVTTRPLPYRFKMHCTNLINQRKVKFSSPNIYNQGSPLGRHITFLRSHTYTIKGGGPVGRDDTFLLHTPVLSFFCRVVTFLSFLHKTTIIAVECSVGKN